MFTMDMAQLVRAALEENGCDAALLGNMDNHSTITLELYNLPSIHIRAEGSEAWLWSRLGKYDGVSLAQNAASLLQDLMQGCSFARSGQLQLAINEDDLILKMLTHPDYLGDGKRFSEALNGFFNALERFSGSLLP